MKATIPALLSAALIFSATETIAADLILHGGRVFTAVADQPLQQAVAVEDGRILAVGSDTEMLELRTSATRLVDLEGGVLMPGLIDAHSHALRGGLLLERSNLFGEMLAPAALERRLREDADSGRARLGETLVMFGFPGEYWNRLDDLETRFNAGDWAEQPILFIGWDYHTGWANRAMREHAGLEAAPSDAGFLAEDDLYQVMDQLPPTPHEELLAGARAALDHYHGLGVTAWMDPTANYLEGQPLDGTAEGWLPVYRELAEAGELRAQVAALLIAEEDADLADLAELRRRYRDVPGLSLPGIKLFLDGVADYPAQTAAMLEPYRNSGQHGELQIDPPALDALVDAADADDWLVHFHAIGDRAVRAALDAVEGAREARDSGLPHSITHLQFVAPDDLERFAALETLAVMQPLWMGADEFSVDLVRPYVSDTAFRYQYPTRSLRDAGATLAGSSDWPITSASPWQAIAQAMTRQGPRGVLGAEEALDREALFLAYTRDAARALRLEDRIGSLAPGKRADMILVDRDVFAVAPEALGETRVLATYIAGQEVFSAPGIPQ